MPVIDISDRLFKRVQAHAVPIVDTFEDVVDRALDALDQDGQRGNGEPSPSGPADGADLVSYVGRVPHGTQIRMKYKGREYAAEVRNGKVWWEGRSYGSLSDAAVAVIRSTGSDRPTENGWRVWHAQNERGRWLPLQDLRKQWR